MKKQLTKNQHKTSKSLNKYKTLTWEEIMASWEKHKDERIYKTKDVNPFGWFKN